MDPSITDEEADEYFREAHEAAKSMAMGGAMGALFTKVPAAGALYMSWTLSYEGTQYILSNTETGQRLNRHVFEYFDRNMLAYEDAVEDLTERLGGESTRMAREDQLRELESRYAQAIRDGRIRLREGATAADVLERIRSGELWTLDELLVSAAEAENPDKGLGTLYMAWLVDASTEVSGKMIWIRAGSVEDFRKLTKFSDVLWGGKSDKLAQKTELFGGKTFESFDEVVELLREQIGSSIVRKRAPLAFPKTYYMAGEYHVGFEIINHDSFAAIKQAAADRPAWADASNDGASSGDDRAPPAGDPAGSGDPDVPGFICASDLGGDDHSGWKPMHDDGDLPPDLLAGPAPWDNPEVQHRIDEWLSRSAPKMPPSPLGRDTRRWLWSEWGQPYCPPSVVLTGKPDAGGKSRYQYLFEMSERLESERHGTLRQYIETGEVAPEAAGGSAPDRGRDDGERVAGSESAPPPEGSDEGMTAPRFEARTVSGRAWSLEDKRGSMTILATFDSLSPQRGIDVRRLSEVAAAAHAEFFNVLWSEPKWYPTGVPQDRVIDPQDEFGGAYRPAEKLSIWIIDESGVVLFRGDLDQGPSPWSGWMNALSAAAPELEWNRMLTEYGSD